MRRALDRFHGSIRKSVLQDLASEEVVPERYKFQDIAMSARHLDPKWIAMTLSLMLHSSIPLVESYMQPGSTGWFKRTFNSEEEAAMLCNPFRSHRILVVGLASAALFLGIPRHAWSQG
jgi:hypothetical protein